MLKSARLRIITVFMSLTILLLIGVAYVNDMQTDNADLVALPTVAQMPTNVPADDSSVERVIPPDMPRTDGIVGVSDTQPADFVLPTDHIERLDSANSEPPQPSVIERPDLSPEFMIDSQVDSAPIDNQVIVRFRADASEQARADYVTSIGGTVVQTIEALSSVVVTIPEGTAIESLPTSDVVIEREAEQYVMALSDVRVPTNDPHYPEQWAFDVLAIGEVWATMPNSLPQVTVATIDSGVCLAHPDLAGRIGAGYDFVDGDTTPEDAYNHGCGVAGIIVAQADNATGIAGIAPNVTLMPLRVLDANGVGTYSDVAQAIIYAVDNGADIINLSLGGVNPSSVLAEAVAYAEARGVQMIAAAGNNGWGAPLYPAAYGGVISVGANDSAGNRTAFSNHNADMTAPGQDIITLSAGGTVATRSGTSYAAAHITALLALDSLTIDAETIATADTSTQTGDNADDGTVTAASVVEISPCVYEVGDAGDGAQTALDDALSDGDSLESAALTVDSVRGTCATVELILFAGEQYLVDEDPIGLGSIFEIAGSTPSSSIEVTVRTNVAGGVPAIIERDNSAPNFRFFRVYQNSSLILQDLELKNGRVSGTGFVYGGAVQSEGSLTLTSVDFTNNIATSTDSDSYGGAIGGIDGTLTIIGSLTADSVFSGNQATAGGAITFEGDQVAINNVLFDNNTAEFAGALNVYTPEILDIASVANGTDPFVEILNTTFSNNTAVDVGAMHVSGNLLSDQVKIAITDSTFTDNGVTGLAGALAVVDIEGTIEGTTFQDNSATTPAVTGKGGALLIANNLTDSLVTISNTLFERNTADVGGAVDILGLAPVLFDTVTFRNNTANDDGGAVHVVYNGSSDTGNTEFRNSTFEDNTASNGLGGAVYSVNESLLVTQNSLFTGNSAFSGGGAVYFVIEDIFDTNIIRDLTITDATFENNQTTAEGGALVVIDLRWQSNTNVAITSTLFEDNTASNGGAVVLANVGFLLDDVTFRGNSASEAGGSGAGALQILDYVDNLDNATVQNSLFENNTADVGGAVDIISYSTVIFDQVDFLNNTANYGAGAVHITPADTNFVIGRTEFRGSTFEGNVANADGSDFDSWGGAIFSRDVDLVISESTSFTNNTAVERGGAIYFWVQGSVDADKSLTITDASFTGNSTTGTIFGMQGGAIDLYSSFDGNVTSTITGSTFTNNDSDRGGAISAFAFDVTISDSVFDGNSAMFGGALFSSDTVLSMTDTDLTNSVALSGGAVVLTAQQATDKNADFTNVTFEGNTANRDNFTFGEGGAVYIQDVTTTFTDTDFIDNSGEYLGGAIALMNVSTLKGMTLTRTTFTDNSILTTDNSAGGAIFAVPADRSLGLTSIQISDSIFSGNSAVIASGIGAVYVDLLIDNTDFIANTGSFGFGASALAFRDSNVVVTNSRFLDNVSSEASALASAFDVQDSTGRFNNNCVVGNTDTAVTVALDNPIPAFDARFNWWGEPAGASNAGTGVWADSVAGDINVSSPLTSAPLGCPSATVPTDNYLTGIITNESGTPLSSMLVTAVDYNGGGYFAETCTNQSGRYVIEDLPANTDIVVHAGGALVNQACGGSDAYMLEYYADDTIPDESVYTPFNATILQSQGNVFSNVDIELGIAGIITVTVEDEDDSQPIQYINVRSEWGSPSYSSVSYCTDFRGEVEIRVPLGVASTVDASARIGACGETPDPYVWEFYADVNNPRGAETITLTEATPTEAITMQLALGGIITGTVADTNSQGLANVSVSVSSFDNTFPEIPIESTYGGGLTDPTGAYTAYGVPFDTPIILHTQSAEYGITFWQDSVMSIDATPVTLTSGTPQQTIDFILEGSAGTISGTVYDADGVTPLAGVPVRIAGASWYSGQTYCTDSNGSYGLFNVNVGSEYIIAAGGLYDGSCANESEPLIYYNQQFDFATATRLTLSQANTTGIDFVLTAESFGTTVDNANISTDEGSEATNSGTYNDVLPSELAISASVGTAVNNNDGTWSWSYTPDDGPAETQTVTLTFDETTSSRQATAEFDLVVNNVAPTGSLTFAQGLQPNTPIDIFFESVADVSSADAGQLSNFTYDVDCDTDGNYEATNVSLANPAVTCTYVSVGSYTVTGILRDKDGGELIDTLAITIAEISPPTLLSATVGATNTDVTLLLEGAPNEVYDVNFYSVASCDGITPTSTPSLLTSISVVTDGNGVFDNTVTLSSITLAPSERILLEADRVVSSDVSVLSDCGLATPTNLSGTSTQISFDLTWQNSDSDQTSTELEVSTNGGSTWSLLQTLGNVTSATVDNLQCGTALSFRVRGVNEVQNRVSAYSNVFTGSTVACPPNDAVASATVFTSLPFTDSQSTLGAISEIGDPQPTCGTNVGNSIWYSFTPATSGTYQFNTIGSDYDAVLAMYTGNIGSLSEIGCDKDSAPGTQAVLNLSLTSGITYRILMGANEGQGGNAVFTARNLLVPTATPVPTNTPLPTLAPDPVLTTVGLYDAELGLWQFRDSNASGYADVVFNWGMDGDGWVGVIGDWDGDGVDGIGMYRDGLWLLRNSATLGNANIEVRFGEAGWQPIVGDWNGDGIDNVGVYRDGQFMLNMNGTVQMFTFDPLGQGGTPIAGDWDGINGDTVGLYNAGVWALADSNMANASANVFSYGEPTWLPVVGDWNENGIDTIGGYRNGRWYLRNHNNAGSSDVAFAFAGVGVPLTSYRGGAPALTMLSENMIIQPTTQPATSTDSPIVLPSSSSMPSLTPTSMPAATSTATPENSPEATEEIP